MTRRPSDGTRVASLRPAILCALLSSLFFVLVGLRAGLDPQYSDAPVYPALPAVSFHAPLPEFRRAPGPAQRVLLISVDGLRPDAIREAKAPVLLGLMARGSVGTHAETIRPSVTLPSHTSMLTGLAFARHGVVWNNYRAGHIAHPTVFSVAAKAGLSTAMLFAKDKFHYLANSEQVHWIFGPGIPEVVPPREDVTKPDFKEFTGPDAKSPRPPPKGGSPGGTPGPAAESRLPPSLVTSAEGLAVAFEEEWPRHKYQLTFVHFGEPDAVGHGRGWMSKSYLAAVLRVDQAIGRLLKVLSAAGELESTAILVTADHGGKGHQHYLRMQPDDPEHVTIPWICAGPGVPQGAVISRLIRTVDTAPTVLSLLGLPPPELIEGSAVKEVLGGR